MQTPGCKAVANITMLMIFALALAALDWTVACYFSWHCDGHDWVCREIRLKAWICYCRVGFSFAGWAVFACVLYMRIDESIIHH